MRLLKHLIYGFFYLLIFTVVLAGIYRINFYESPTCFDNIKNQNETDVDCGGECEPCEIKNASLEVREVKTLVAGEDKSTIVAEIQNPINYSATFEYRVNIFGNFGVPLLNMNGISSVGPKGVRYVIIPGVDIKFEDISRAGIEVSQTKWSEESGTNPYSIEVRGVETTTSTSSIRVTGSVFNDSLDVLKRVRVTAIIKDTAGNIVTASAVNVESIGVSREKGFTVFFPSLGETGGSETETVVFGEIVPEL